MKRKRRLVLVMLGTILAMVLAAGLSAVAFDMSGRSVFVREKTEAAVRISVASAPVPSTRQVPEPSAMAAGLFGLAVFAFRLSR